MFNHNCNPNADWQLKNGRIVVRATRDVAAGEELCITYVNPKHPTLKRQAELRRRFYFECACSTCEAADDLPPLTRSESRKRRRR